MVHESCEFFFVFFVVFIYLFFVLCKLCSIQKKITFHLDFDSNDNDEKMGKVVFGCMFLCEHLNHSQSIPYRHHHHHYYCYYDMFVVVFPIFFIQLSLIFFPSFLFFFHDQWQQQSIWSIYLSINDEWTNFSAYYCCCCCHLFICLVAVRLLFYQIKILAIFIDDNLSFEFFFCLVSLIFIWFALYNAYEFIYLFIYLSIVFNRLIGMYWLTNNLNR